MKHALLFPALLFLTLPAAAQLLDSTFALNGYTQTTSFTGTATDMSVASDGKIILSLDKRVGENQTCWSYVCRYEPDGTLDSAFGINGLAKVWSAGDDVVVNSVSVQPDGKIVFTGHGDYCNQIVCGMNNIVVGRFTAQGVIDSSFGTNGQVLCGPLFGAYIMESLGQHVAVLPNGQILVSGRIYDQVGGVDVFVARLNSDGSLDPSYGADGDGISRLGNYASVEDMHVGNSGEVHLTGIAYIQNDTNNLSDSYVFRLTPGGVFDNSFGSQGKVFLNAAKFDFMHALALRQDGKIVLGGCIRRVPANFSAPIDTAAIFMLEPNGALSSVIPQGFRLLHMPKPASRIYDLEVASGNAIFITGTLDSAYRTDAFVGRLNSDASFDPSFSGTGESFVYYHLGVFTTYQAGTMLYDMQRISPAQILVSGGRNHIPSTKQSVLLMRLNATESITTSIAAPGGASFEIYPNPFNEIVRLENSAQETGTYALYNAGGQLLRKERLSAGTMQLDLREFADGLYLLVVETESGKRSFRMIKGN